MTPRRPPRIALWLMDCFLVGQAISGDLLERHVRGRSRVWFWRQALLAVAIRSGKDLVTHKLLLVRAIVVGFLTLNVLARLEFALLPLFVEVTPIRHPVVLRLLMIAISTFTGWLIARLHRPHSGAMVLGFIGVYWLALAPQLVRNATNLLQHERFRPYITAWLMNCVGATVCVLAGGLLAAAAYGHRAEPGLQTEHQS